MASHEFASEQSVENKRRVVELEIKLPQITAKPLKDAARAVLLTGIGASALTVRGITNAAKAAHRAGAEVAENPDPITRLLLRLVGESRTEEKETPPIEDYDTLAATAILEHLDDLEPEKLRALRAYESANKQRVTVLRAIDQRLGEEQPSQG
ncbi:MAG: hypothetical protein U9R48_04965 [Chloroflexota bacterium]|nr:hypothetical protein [Chloroflexota bacterium]